MKIIFSGSKTAGHLKPLIALAFRFKKLGYQTIFIGGLDDTTKKYVTDCFDEIHLIKIKNINRKNIFKNKEFIKNFINAKKQIQPYFDDVDFVITSGGLISYLVCKEAQRKKIKYYVHEQNTTLGLSNSLVCKKASNVFLTFPIKKVSGIVVGNPCVELLQKYPKKETDYYNILFLGGSLGSDFILELALYLSQYIQDSHIKFIVVSPKIIQEDYPGLEVINYHEDMGSLISKSDLIVSRAGSGSICEIMSINRPLILIPSINVSNDHQMKNALYLKKLGCCLIFDEKKLHKEDLLLSIINLLKDENKRNVMLEAQKKTCLLNAGGSIVEHLL